MGASAAHLLTNYHSHTPYCDGRCDIDEFAATAEWLGFASYGVTPTRRCRCRRGAT